MKLKLVTRGIKTKSPKDYGSPVMPFLRLIDTRGIEFNEWYDERAIEKDASNNIKKNYETKVPNNFIFVFGIV